MKSIMIAVTALLIATGCSSFHPINIDALAAHSYFYNNPSKKMALYIMKEYLTNSLNDPKMGRELRGLTLDETGFEATCIFNDPSLNNFGVTLTKRAHWDSLSELRVEESGVGSNRVIRASAIFMAPDLFYIISQSRPGHAPKYQADLVCAIRVLSGSREKHHPVEVQVPPAANLR